MPALTVRDIPEGLYERLRERAARHRRSLSKEVVNLLEESLLPRRVDVAGLIAEAEALNARFTEPLPDLAAEGKRAGRRFDVDHPSGR